MKEMKNLKAAAELGMSGVPTMETPPLSKWAPYTLSGYGGILLGYWTKEMAMADARKYATEGFPIQVWTSFGKRVFPEPSNRSGNDTGSGTGEG